MEKEKCDHIHDKIILFNDLNAEEREGILQHVEQCDNCRNKLREFQSIAVSINHFPSDHAIDDKTLERYSIHLEDPDEADYDGQRLGLKEIRAIQKHLEECIDCRKKVEQYRLEYREILHHFEQTELSKVANTKVDPDSSPSGNKGRIFTFYAIRIGAAAAILLLLWFSPFFRGNENPYSPLATIDQPAISLVTRSNQPETTATGFNAFEKGSYQQAIPELEAYLQTNRGASNIFSPSFALGVSYLATAKSEVLGRFKKVNQVALDKAIDYLQSATGSTDNIGYLEACYWYLGKAYLLKQDSDQAKAFFEEVVKINGNRHKEAKDLIIKIEEILPK